MSRMRSSMSEKNQYYIPKERYLELLHFCRQYWDFCTRLTAVKILQSEGAYISLNAEKDPIDLTSEAAIEIDILQKKIVMIRDSAKEAAPDIWNWIIDGVTENFSYDALKFKGLPCGKDYYYDRYHRFFYILDQKRN